MPKEGDTISLRVWTDKPYRSKQRVLLKSTIKAVSNITMEDTGRELLVSIGGNPLTPEEINFFARNDGFSGAVEMFNWFQTTHGLPFSGIVIKW